MKIESLRAVVRSLPMQEHQIMGAGELAGHADNVFVIVRSDDGVIGFGEAATWALFCAETPSGIRDLVNDHLAAILEGCPVLDLNANIARIDAAILGNPAAKCAVEMALCDLAARSLGVPAVALFGGQVRDSIGLSYSVSAQDAAVERDIVQRRYAEGYRIFKVKTGVQDWRADLARLTWLCGMAEDVTVRLDYNGMASIPELNALLPGLSELPIDFIEQPFAPHDYHGLAWLRAHCRFPLSADEGCRGRADLRRVVESGCYDTISLKVGKFGGLYATKAVASVANTWGVSGYAGAYSESRLGTSAALQLMLSLDNLRDGCDYYFSLVAVDDGLTGGFVDADGRLRPTDADGFGVSLPEEWFR